MAPFRTPKNMQHDFKISLDYPHPPPAFRKFTKNHLFWLRAMPLNKNASAPRCTRTIHTNLDVHSTMSGTYTYSEYGMYETWTKLDWQHFERYLHCCAWEPSFVCVNWASEPLSWGGGHKVPIRDARPFPWKNRLPRPAKGKSCPARACPTEIGKTRNGAKLTFLLTFCTACDYFVG